MTVEREGKRVSGLVWGDCMVVRIEDVHMGVTPTKGAETPA